jgi:uncharacterized protein YbjT (DUF2867 family)
MVYTFLDSMDFDEGGTAMKILILGATGRTGKLVIEEAMKQGHEPVAVARDPSKLAGMGATVVSGTPYEPETIRSAMPGCEAVITTLNVSRNSDFPWAALRAPTDLISKSAANAVEAMKEHGVRRIVALGALGAGSSRAAMPGLMRFVIDHSNLRPAFEDHGRQEALLTGSGMDFTVARAPMLTNDETDRGIAVKREGDDGKLRPKLGRRSAARFFVEIIEKKLYLGEVIGISNAR